MKSLTKVVQKSLIVLTPILILFSSNFVLTRRVFADEPTPTNDITSELEPTLPEITHQYLGSYAAESHGNSLDQIEWIGQGAYDEDHQPFPMQGWHSWDPDNGDFWWFPLSSGTALERANILFWQAVEMHQTDVQGSWGLLGQSLHLLQDVSTPAHAHADSHICITNFYPQPDCDYYETWLKFEDFINTLTWFNNNSPNQSWDMLYTEIPEWSELTPDLQIQLGGAFLEYGQRSSGQELWVLGPTGSDPVLFRLMYLMAEMSDSYSSGGKRIFPGEVYYPPFVPHTDDPVYLSEMRDTLFPFVIRFSTAWIDYFEHQLFQQNTNIFLPLILR